MSIIVLKGTIQALQAIKNSSGNLPEQYRNQLAGINHIDTVIKNLDTVIKNLEEIVPLDKDIYCTNCGNLLEPDEVFVWDDGSLTGMCSGCRHVTSDYTNIYNYDEFDEDDECCYLPECTCETCLQNHPERLVETDGEHGFDAVRIN